jgi:hypothetical protein
MKTTNNAPRHVDGIGMFDTTVTRKFKTQILFKTTELTGLLVCKQTAGGTIVGSFINEFGVKAFDLTITSRRAKLTNVLTYIDKWYIRKTIASDFHFLLFTPPCLKDCMLGDTLVSVAPISCSKRYVYKLNNNMLSYQEQMFMHGSCYATKLLSRTADGISISMKHEDGSLMYDLDEIR